MDALDRLDNCLCGGISEGRWCFFHDTNNQSGLCGSYVPDAYDYLEKFLPGANPAEDELPEHTANTATDTRSPGR